MRSTALAVAPLMLLLLPEAANALRLASPVTMSRRGIGAAFLSLGTLPQRPVSALADDGMEEAPAASQPPEAAVPTAAAPPEVAAPPPPPAATSITYDALAELLSQCRNGQCNVSKVAFTSTNGETGDAIFTDGSRLPILGIPEDNPTNDSSPYKLMAKCRDAKVPYSLPFADNLAKYRGSVNLKPNIISGSFLSR